MAENMNRFGRMWECPDFFTLDGQNVLIVSTMEMEAEELEYPNGNGVVCEIGHFDNQTGQFHSIFLSQSTMALIFMHHRLCLHQTDAGF